MSLEWPPRLLPTPPRRSSPARRRTRETQHAHQGSGGPPPLLRKRPGKNAMSSALLAIDQGTTNSKAVLISTEGDILARGASPVGIEHPRPGWVEQSPRRIWGSVLEA